MNNAAANSFITSLIDIMKNDPRFMGLSVRGSFCRGNQDIFSDLDLTLIASDKGYPSVLAERIDIASKAGELYSCFAGYHIGEPALLICLYGPELMHVDLKVTDLSEFVISNNIISGGEKLLWEWNGAVSTAISNRYRGAEAGIFSSPRGDNQVKALLAYPSVKEQNSLQYIEDRFWIWLHDGYCKAARGELFAAIDTCNFLRVNAIAPVIALVAGVQAFGIRHIEAWGTDYLGKMAATLPSYSRPSVFKCLKELSELYFALRYQLADDGFIRREEAEEAVQQWVSELAGE